MADQTILLYGRTNSGKTAQIGVLAEHVFMTTGKITRLYTVDRGGTDTIKPYINLGIIDAVEVGDSDPWIFLHKAVRGHIRDKNGKWVLDEEANKRVGLYAFESMRSFAEEMMQWMARASGKGLNIGGGSNIAFQVQGDGETLKVAGSNQSHYGVAQGRVTEELWESQRLPCQYLVWTSSVSKDDDLVSAGKVLGPDVIGKSLTTEVPRWFDRTYRLDVYPARDGKPERHVLFLGNTVDVNAGNASGLGNTRYPLDAPPIQQVAIEPANIVQAIQMLDGGTQKAEDVIRKRLGDKLKSIKA